MYFGNCETVTGGSDCKGKGAGERQAVSEGEVDVVKVVEGREGAGGEGERLKEGCG